MTALGTTRAQAGSFEAQRRIDFDLNLAMAKASKESGSRIGVLISSTGTSAKSIMPYSKLKGETELAFKDVGFEYTIILRPGLLMGQRDDSRPAEAILRKVAGGLGAISSHLIDFWAQDSAVIARAAVSAALQWYVLDLIFCSPSISCSCCLAALFVGLVKREKFETLV